MIEELNLTLEEEMKFIFTFMNRWRREVFDYILDKEVVSELTLKELFPKGAEQARKLRDIGLIELADIKSEGGARSVAYFQPTRKGKIVRFAFTEQYNTHAIYT